MKKGQKHSLETIEKFKKAKLKNPVKYWKGKTHSEETKKKISQNRKGITAKEKHPLWGKKHSSETKQKIIATLKYKYSTGQLVHPNKGKHTYNYKDFRKEVFERDNYKCRFCKKESVFLEVDHIIPKKERPDLLLEISNARTLCLECHKRVTFGWNLYQKYDFRQAFIEAVIKRARTDKRILFTICDVGFKNADKFQKEFPERYFNFGVTEQSTMILNSTLALSGFRPIFYSMINFSIFRPLEMIRNAVFYHQAPVLISGVGGSKAYRFLGFSHNCNRNEDINILSDLTIGNFKIYIPMADKELEPMINQIFDENYPAYIRL